MPVNRRQINEALAEYLRVRALYGPVGVTAYSEACFDAQNRSRDLNAFDYCVAFDHAASAYDGGMTQSRPLPRQDFSDAQLAARHAGAARLFPQDYAGIEERMDEIIGLTYTAIAGKAAVEPELTVAPESGN